MSHARIKTLLFSFLIFFLSFSLSPPPPSIYSFNSCSRWKTWFEWNLHVIEMLREISAFVSFVIENECHFLSVCLLFLFLFSFSCFSFFLALLQFHLSLDKVIYYYHCTANLQIIHTFYIIKYIDNISDFDFIY